MGVSILWCECGLRVRAPGATAGRVGRCPRCGQRLTVPEAPAPVPAPAEPLEGEDPPGEGYLLGPARVPEARSEAGTGPPHADPATAPRRASSVAPKVRAPMADGLLPTLDRPEAWWLPSVLYPLRGAESLGLVATLGVAFWVLAMLVPEYCLGIWRDANSLGTPSMGRLVILISALPAAIVFPLAVVYGLQYLGRVLVASAQGDSTPPRLPDRNADGLLNGLGPWLRASLLGGVVGLAPLAAYSLVVGEGSRDVRIVAVLVLLGLPYAQMALMLSFLHDDDLAATPARVLASMALFRVAYAKTCLVTATALGLATGAFALALELRERSYGLYLVAGLACCVLVPWIGIVVMRNLGNAYYAHRKVLRWHTKRPRWGVTWGL